MISDIYIMGYSFFKKFEDETSFHNFILEVLPECLIDHLPDSIHLVSVDYKQDEVVDSFLQYLVSDMIFKPLEVLSSGISMESGYYHLQFESEESLSFTRSETLEFVFSEIQALYFSASFFCYLGDEVIHPFSSAHFDSVSEPVDEFQDLNLDNYVTLLKTYLYGGEIPEEYAGEVAKMMLVRGL